MNTISGSAAVSGLLFGAMLLVGAGCGSDDGDAGYYDGAGKGFNTGTADAALEAPCGGQYTCTLFTPGEAPIGPIPSRSHRASAWCLLDDVKTEANEMTALENGGHALLLDRLASWSMEGTSLVLVPDGTQSRLVCSIAGGSGATAGPAATKKSCKGTALKCEYRATEDCVGGCSYYANPNGYGGKCYGSAPACSAQSSEGKCGYTPGCAWE